MFDLTEFSSLLALIQGDADILSSSWAHSKPEQLLRVYQACPGRCLKSTIRNWRYLALGTAGKCLMSLLQFLDLPQQCCSPQWVCTDWQPGRQGQWPRRQRAVPRHPSKKSRAGAAAITTVSQESIVTRLSQKVSWIMARLLTHRLGQGEPAMKLRQGAKPSAWLQSKGKTGGCSGVSVRDSCRIKAGPGPTQPSPTDTRASYRKILLHWLLWIAG